MLLAACTPEDKPSAEEPDKGTKETIERSFYAKGADISWATQIEADGVKFRNTEGQEKECTALMKEIGMNSIRLRVWVDPKDGWCGKDDVLVKAARAQALGMNIMLDFHYSDSWADPSKQIIPAAWSGYDAQKISDALVKHTTEVLGTLKDKKIDIKWIQIGNEVNSGMLHPLGKVEGSSASGFAGIFNAGYIQRIE
jgi:arabinogalactan endo-1,4-beta-galactosidase